MIVLLISCHHDCIVSSWSQWTSCSRWVDFVALNIILIHNIIDLQSHLHRNQNHLFPIPSKTCLPLTSLGVQSRSRRIVQAAIAPHGLCPPEKVPQIIIRIRMMTTLMMMKIMKMIISILKQEEERACLAAPCFNFQWVVRWGRRYRKQNISSKKEKNIFWKNLSWKKCYSWLSSGRATSSVRGQMGREWRAAASPA